MTNKNFKVKNAIELGDPSIFTSGGELTVPVTTDTLVGRQTEDTLKNKSLLSVEEVIQISSSGASSTINFDVINYSILYYTLDASANWTLNVRGDSSTTLDSILDVGKSLTVVFFNTNGTTAYYQNDFQIDGVSRTIKWQGGETPSEGNASSVDIYSFTIIKTSSTPEYTIIGSLTGFA